MTNQLKAFADYVRAHDGFSPRINFQHMYAKFPELEFETVNGYGDYVNFGQAYEYKKLDMIVKDGNEEIYVVYREYGDANENLAYIA